MVASRINCPKKNQQKAIIAMHIPMSLDVYATPKIRLFTLLELWKPHDEQRFRSELAAYSGEIAGVFAGHLHSDWLHILTFNDVLNEIPLMGTPAISPIFGNNPGFKLYSYSPAHALLKETMTYYYPLNGQKTWRGEHKFDLTYQSQDKDDMFFSQMCDQHHVFSLMIS